MKWPLTNIRSGICRTRAVGGWTVGGGGGGEWDEVPLL